MKSLNLNFDYAYNEVISITNTCTDSFKYLNTQSCNSLDILATSSQLVSPIKSAAWCRIIAMVNNLFPISHQLVDWFGTRSQPYRVLSLNCGKVPNISQVLWGLILDLATTCALCQICWWQRGWRWVVEYMCLGLNMLSQLVFIIATNCRNVPYHFTFSDIVIINVF